MKFSAKSSSRRVNRKAHFSAPSSVRHKLMVSPLSKELRGKHHVRNLPIRKDDEVKVVRGSKKGSAGKVVAVYRKKWVIHVDKVTRNRPNGAVTQIGIDPSKVEITKIKIDKDRKKILDRRDTTKGLEKGKGKYTTDEIQ